VTEQGKRGWVYDIHRSARGTQYADIPSRHFYLDGVLKAVSDDAAVTGESFVHPAMLAHPHPTSVLILGSATGATVKEVLKHTTVESLSLAGVDQALLAFSRESLQSWNNCSDIIGVADSCLDDKRVTPIYSSGYSWLQTQDFEQLNGAQFDVILVDML
jgi:spermidine synthase